MGRDRPRSSIGGPNARTARSRRRFLALAAAACAPACSHSRLLELTETTARDLFFAKRPEVSLTRQRVDTIPYASIAVKLGRVPRTLLTLARLDQSDRHWLSSDRIALVTRGGRLVRTAGLPANLTATGFYDPDPVVDGTLHTTAGGYRLRRSVDMQPDNRIGVLIESTLDVGGPETIEILERPFETLRVLESSKAIGTDWNFTNTYWADRNTGFVWKSIQHFVPELPPAEIEVLKAAAA